MNKQNNIFQFHGNGKEYFKIWISNLMLSIITLGIYGAWAKVRTNRYFYGNTEYQGHRFDYLASPIAILKGRLIAIAFLIIYAAGSNINPIIGTVLFVIFLLVMPWIISRSLRFNARISQFKNVRFDFVGKTWGAFKAFLLWPMLGILSLGFLMPIASKKSASYVIDNYRYGDLEFKNKTPLGEFYTIFFKTIGLFILIFIVLAAIGYGLVSTLDVDINNPQEAKIIILPLLFIAYLVMFFIIGAYQMAARTNAIYNSTRLDGKHKFLANFHMRDLIKLFLKYGFLTIVTLGFGWPWLKVALANYKAGHTLLNLDGNLDEVTDKVANSSSAIGDELGDAFDVGAGVL